MLGIISTRGFPETFRAMSSRAEIKMLSLRIAIKIRQIFGCNIFRWPCNLWKLWLSFHNIITYFKIKKVMAQQTITSSNTTIETLKKDMFKIKICSKLKLMKPEHQWIRSGVFIVNFEYILHVFQVFLWLTLSK